MIDEKAIENFWEWLLLKRDVIEKSKADDPIRNELLVALQHIHGGLFYELSLSQIPFELVITSEGKESLFELVEKVTRFAPVVSGWRFVALKQPMGFDFKTQYEGVCLEPEKMWFLPLLNNAVPSMLGLRVGIEGYDIEQKRDFQNAVLMILDTALGERCAAKEINYVETGPLPENPGAEGYIELPELPRYMNWRKARLAKPEGSKTADGAGPRI